MKKFLGVQYPLVKTPRGTFAQKNGIDQIKADLLQLLLTNPGERCMLPEDGTPLRKLFFEPSDSIIVSEAKAKIAKSIATWEPRVIIDNISVSINIDSQSLSIYDSKEESDHILSIKIMIIDPENITEINELALELPIGGN